jgi:cold shock CspA family protein
MDGTITFESQKGWWLVEADETSELYWIHHSSVYRNRNLHPRDRVTFSVAPNPMKPGYVHAVNVVWVGRLAPNGEVRHGR